MLIQPVRKQLAAIPSGAKVCIACSGGPDSTALAFSVRQARPDLQLYIAHVRHGLRVDDWQDAQCAQVIADRINATYLQTNLRMSDIAHDGNGPEDAARQARWNALAAMAKQADCKVIAVGHTADDQAETVLLRLARGTGPEGLAGMVPVLDRRINGYDVTIIRPMLFERREIVHTFAYSQGVSIAQDPTNNDPVQRRARARHSVLPAMATLRPDERDAVDAIVRLSQVQREQTDLLAAYLSKVPLFQWGNAVLIPDNSHVHLDLPAHCLDAFYAGLMRRAIPMVGTYPQPDRARIDTIVGMGIGGRLDLPYGRVATRDKFGWLLTGNVAFEMEGVIQPSEGHSLSQDDLCNDGSCCSGLRHDGLSYDGLSHDGPCHNGSCCDGMAHDGLCCDGMAHDGLAHDSACREHRSEDGVYDNPQTNHSVTRATSLHINPKRLHSIQITAKNTGVINEPLGNYKSMAHPICRVMPPLPWTIPMSATLRPAELSIRTRNEDDRSLRKVFQRFPTGLREHLPVVEQGNTVVAVGPVLM